MLETFEVLTVVMRISEDRAWERIARTTFVLQRDCGLKSRKPARANICDEKVSACRSDI